MDYELANRVMTKIEEHPSEWDQFTWADAKLDGDGNVCQTTACFAGHVLVESGQYRLDSTRMPQFVQIATGELFEPFEAEWLAAEILGLSDSAASDIFHYFTNDPSELRRRMENVFANPSNYRADD